MLFHRRHVFVASFSEAWIEIKFSGKVMPRIIVASFSEAWIEIGTVWSLVSVVTVASFSEAWIEIRLMAPAEARLSVASFSEAWIEITVSDATAIAVILSPPSRRRGLKLRYQMLPPLQLYCRLLLGGVD